MSSQQVHARSLDDKCDTISTFHGKNVYAKYKLNHDDLTDQEAFFKIVANVMVVGLWTAKGGICNNR